MFYTHVPVFQILQGSLQQFLLQINDSDMKIETLP